ncbi:DUF2924 domain-containing protein [Erythrobacter aurantius]|uniref:DUF2924 domain-containing protein n=1 Tax=Erythrobacter aurantius TaxID=2909249 RepID=UPI00207AABD2|nr:DUF2924 domain-containing protein [Erythrobacter aurantius]
MQRADLDTELAALATLSLAQLREKWKQVTDKPAPRVSAAMLRLALAWELQVSVYGGLSRRTQQTLDQLARGNTQTRATQPGMRLMREWNGTLHVVTVDDDGTIRWNDQQWKSLSAVARAITGTRWSGPAFFGLKPRRAA